MSLRLLLAASIALMGCQAIASSLFPAGHDEWRTFDPRSHRVVEGTATLEVGAQYRFHANLHCGTEWLAHFNDQQWRIDDPNELTEAFAPADWLREPFATNIELDIRLVSTALLLARRSGSDVVVPYVPAGGFVPCE